MALLRRTTTGHHEMIERRLDLQTRLSSVSAYRTLLERLYSFYGPLEGRLQLPARRLRGLDLEARRKTPLLAADLRKLGSDHRAIAAARRLPQVCSPSQALGVMYVLEGATLGGKVIARIAHRRLGVVPGEFFGAYGDEVGSRWLAFGATVEAFTGGQPSAEMCCAALDCFEQMAVCLCD